MNYYRREIGHKLNTYLFTYRYEGADWSFAIHAASREEAMSRLRALQYATYDGDLVARIPALPGAGLLARAVCWIRNFFA